MPTERPTVALRRLLDWSPVDHLLIIAGLGIPHNQAEEIG
jgi:hypothetical protein